MQTKRALALITALLLIAAPLASCSRPLAKMSASELLDIGKEHLLDTDYEQAIVHFNRLLEIEPHSQQGYTGLAESYLALDEIGDAIDILRDGFEELPDSKRFLRQLAGIYDEIIEDFPSERDAYIGLADVHIALGSTGDAIATLEQGLQQLPGNTRIRAMLESLRPPEPSSSAATPSIDAYPESAGTDAPSVNIGFEEYPIGDDIEVGPLNVAGVYYYPVDVSPPYYSLPAAESDMHIEADISALPDNELGYGVGDFVPNLTVDYIITDSAGTTVAEGTFMPMSASDGPHYGANIKLGNAGTYKVQFIIKSPEDNGYLLHTDAKTGVTGKFWAEPLIAEWDFNWVPFEW